MADMQGQSVHVLLLHAQTRVPQHPPRTHVLRAARAPKGTDGDALPEVVVEATRGEGPCPGRGV